MSVEDKRDKARPMAPQLLPTPQAVETTAHPRVVHRQTERALLGVEPVGRR